jgi:hypothetical protein
MHCVLWSFWNAWSCTNRLGLICGRYDVTLTYLSMKYRLSGKGWNGLWDEKKSKNVDIAVLHCVLWSFRNAWSCTNWQGFICGRYDVSRSYLSMKYRLSGKGWNGLWDEKKAKKHINVMKKIYSRLINHFYIQFLKVERVKRLTLST